MTIRTRFAPSPTGYLHIGGARTALYAWLYAKKHQGSFILRIEDTDVERSSQESVEAIFKGLEWLGLSYDEGPFYQTQRFERYKTVIQQLLTQGKAYQCYCSRERLDALRQQQMTNKQKPRYDGHCRHQTTELDQPYVVRFKNPEQGAVKFQDLIRGDIEFQNTELDDLIIARSDSTPTYNFTVVVDDWDMQITHVIRGDDHINNTPRQINILQALGATLPSYAHVPMILGADGKRLSKRHGAVSVLQYRDEGYLPEALLNYLVRLGWSHGDQEIFSLQEMIDLFNLDNVSKSPAAFNPEKLLWLNHHYIKTLMPVYVAEHLKWHFQQLNVNIDAGPELSEVVLVQRERTKTLTEMAQQSLYFYQDFTAYEEKAAKKNLTQEALPVLQHLQQQFSETQDWAADILHQVVLQTAELLALSLGKVAQPLRVALTGGTISPPIDQTLKLLGKDQVLYRLKQAIDFIQNS